MFLNILFDDNWQLNAEYVLVCYGVSQLPAHRQGNLRVAGHYGYSRGQSVLLACLHRARHTASTGIRIRKREWHGNVGDNTMHNGCSIRHNASRDEVEVDGDIGPPDEWADWCLGTARHGETLEDTSSISTRTWLENDSSTVCYAYSKYYCNNPLHYWCFFLLEYPVF